MKWRVALTAIAAIFLLPTVAGAQEVKNKGLFITPLRNYLSVQPGKTASGTFTVANITDQPATIDLSVEQFSVQDYSYDYQFTPPRDDWVKLNKTQTTLQPNKSESIAYTIAAPATATPGGHYFTLIATTQIPGNPNTIRAATVLYITAEGKLLRTSSIVRTSIPAMSFGTDITFTMDVKNTGNTHYFVYVSGRLEGLSAKSDQPHITNLLLPGKTRTASSTIPAPLLPGIYQAVYGFKVDDGQIVERKQIIWYLPPWSLLVPAGIIWLVFVLRKRRR